LNNNDTDRADAVSVADAISLGYTKHNSERLYWHRIPRASGMQINQLLNKLQHVSRGHRSHSYTNLHCTYSLTYLLI